MSSEEEFKGTMSDYIFYITDLGKLCVYMCIYNCVPLLMVQLLF